MNGYTENVELKPIGVVRSAVNERKAMPSLGAGAAVEVFPEFAEGLLRFEKHSHIWVLVWLDRVERDVLQVTPRGVADRGPDGLHGVFAVRSPARPNPIGLTATRVLAVDGLWIEVERLDFLEGTPVIDVKPYFVTRDMIYSAGNAMIGLPAGAAALRESLIMQAVNFHGEKCRDLALAVRIVENFRTRYWALGDPPRWEVAAPISRPCLVDALMGMTRVSPGRGNLRLWQRDAVSFPQPGCMPQYEIPGELPEGFEGVLEAPERALFVFWPAPA